MNGKVISGPAAILILFLFFFPWVAVSCDGLPKSEFSGYQLAAGAELNGDPIFFVVPIAAVVTLLLLASTLWNPSWETHANWGMVTAAITGLLVFLLEWLQLRGQSSAAFELTVLPALWITVAALLGIGLGALFDIWRPQGQQSARLPAGKPASRPGIRPVQPTPQAPPPGSVPYREKANNYTMVDDWVRPEEPNATIVDDDMPQDNPNLTITDDDRFPSAVRARLTLLDDDMAASGDPAFPGSGKDVDDDDTTAVSGNPYRAVEPTELLHSQPKTMAWLVIGNGKREGERIPLKAKMTIGRDPNSDIFIHDTALSALHVRVQLVHGRYIAFDQNSTNGLYALDPQQNLWEKKDQVLLQEGTQIRLGRTVLQFKTMHPER